MSTIREEVTPMKEWMENHWISLAAIIVSVIAIVKVS